MDCLTDSLYKAAGRLITFTYSPNTKDCFGVVISEDLGLTYDKFKESDKLAGSVIEAS